MIRRAKIHPETLAPTSRAAYFYDRRIFNQIRQWPLTGEHLNFLDWRKWEEKDNRLIPITADLDIAPPTASNKSHSLQL